jgi:hypothetical protein
MAEYDTIGGGATGAATGGLAGAVGGYAVGAKVGAIGGPLGMAVGAVLGGLFGSKKKKVQKPPSYSQMMNYNLDAQAGIQNKLLGLEGEYRPKYQGLQEQTLQNQLYGGSGNKGYINMLNQANDAMLGVQNRYAGNYMNTIGGLTGQARNILESPANQAMHSRLMADAQRDLSLGSALGADEQRMAFQTANQAMAQRGLTGRQGTAAGVLANYGLGQQRLNERRAFASGMMGSETALQNAALQVSQGAMGGYAGGAGFLGQANTLLGQYQPQIFQPESQMGVNAQGMNYQHNAAIAQSKLQQQQGLLSSVATLGMMSIQNPNMFNFGSTSNVVAPTLTTPSSYLNQFGGIGYTNGAGLGVLAPR